MRYPLYVALLSVLITPACTEPQSSGPSQTTASLSKFTYYGNFCGPGIPEVSDGPIGQQIAETEGIEALDDLDWACKEHDLCYMRIGQGSPICDELIMYILDHWSLPVGCNNLGYDIKATFRRQYMRPGQSILQNLIEFPISATKKLVDHAINLMDPSDSYEDVKKNNCNFDRKNREIMLQARAKAYRDYGSVGPRYGPALDWGRPLPRSMEEAEKIFEEIPDVSKSKKASAAYDAGTILLYAQYNYRDESGAEVWFKKCERIISACAERVRMIQYKREFLGYAGQGLIFRTRL